MRTVEELSYEELDELRDRLFHQMLDYGSIEEVFEKEIECSDEIPMDFVKTYYADTLFVEEDFWCNVK